MNNSDYSDLDAEIIDITPGRKRERSGAGKSKWIIFAAVFLLLMALLSGVCFYVDSLWFDSVGYASRFWSIFALSWILFAVFGISTFLILRAGFYFLERFFGLDKFAPRKIIVNKQPVEINPARFLKPLGSILAFVFGISYAFGLSSDWQSWTLFMHQPSTENFDPIFHRPIGFYLFSLPVYQELFSWLTALAVILLVAAIVCAGLSAVPQQTTLIDEKQPSFMNFGTRAFSAVSVALGALLLPVAAQVLPFTPASRNNMIAWMAGRSDGAAYGQLLVYNFPLSRVIDGPSQIEARIDQDAQLSGQITLWNQQGSKVKRGNLIVMPIGTGLLFVEPIYLQAERSPMHELRLVVLATQEKLTYAAKFETALNQLLGGAAQTNSKDAETKNTNDASGDNQMNAALQSTGELVKLAAKTFDDYQRLTSEGKLGKAGQKLDELKRILGYLQKR